MKGLPKAPLYIIDAKFCIDRVSFVITMHDILKRDISKGTLGLFMWYWMTKKNVDILFKHDKWSDNIKKWLVDYE